jgi:hypothetical protein
LSTCPPCARVPGWPPPPQWPWPADTRAQAKHRQLSRVRWGTRCQIWRLIMIADALQDVSVRVGGVIKAHTKHAANCLPAPPTFERSTSLSSLSRTRANVSIMMPTSMLNAMMSRKTV